MQIDTGEAVVIVAVLIFYLRLIILQRERARRLRTTATSPAKKSKPKDRQDSLARLSILSPSRRDRIIATAGAVAIVVGVLLYGRLLPLPTVQAYWWIPTAVGIVAFSWAFRL